MDSAGGDNTAFIDQVVASPVAAGPPLVPDHGFEQDSLGYGAYTYTPTTSPWTFSPQSGSNGSGISYNDSGFTYLDANAPQGVQVAFLQGTGWFGQSVANWAAGTYQIDFSAAQRGHSGSYQPFQQDFEVLIDGVAVGIFTPSGTSYQTYTTAPFTVTAGSHTIMFQGLDRAGGDNTAFIDQIVIDEAASPPPIADRSFEQTYAGPSGYFNSFVKDPSSSLVVFLRRGRRFGQRQRLHLGQSAGPRRLTGRLPSDDRLVQPGRHRLGRRLLPGLLPGRPAVH